MAKERGAPHAVNPHILWADRLMEVFLDVQIANFEEQKIVFSKKSVEIKGINKEIPTRLYHVQLNLVAEIIPEKCHYKVLGPSLRIVLAKRDEQRWPHLIEERRAPWLKIDWRMWLDREAEDAEIAQKALEQLEREKDIKPEPIRPSRWLFVFLFVALVVIVAALTFALRHIRAIPRPPLRERSHHAVVHPPASGAPE